MTQGQEQRRCLNAHYLSDNLPRGINRKIRYNIYHIVYMTNEIVKRATAPTGVKEDAVTVNSGSSTPTSSESTSFTSQLSKKILSYVGNYAQAPEFIKDNIYIKSGYRINFQSLKCVGKSLFMVHNEMVNIWSHFLGAILIIVLSIFFLTQFGNADFVSWKQGFLNQISDGFEPLYHEIIALEAGINTRLAEGVQILKEDFEVIESNVKLNLHSLYNEI